MGQFIESFLEKAKGFVLGPSQIQANDVSSGEELPTENDQEVDTETLIATTPSESKWKVSKMQIAEIDKSLDPSELRWVGTDFIHFFDIPWDYELEDQSSKAARTNTGSEEVDALGLGSSDANNPSLKVSTRSVTIGLLEDIMDMTIPEDVLLTLDTSGQRVLSADQLSRLVVPWANGLRRSEASSHGKDPLGCDRGKWNIDHYHRVVHALDDFVYAGTGSLLDDGAYSHSLCAIAIMLACIETCIQAIWQVGGAAILGHTRMAGEVTQILRRKLSARWGDRASFEMERLFSGGLPFAAFAIAYPPTVNNVATVDTANYLPKHVTADCTCAFVKPSSSAVRELVRKNEVPVILFDGSSIVVQSAKDTPYVAISHVWADGLGSTTEVGLPTCQVQRLTNLSKKLVPSGAFWQDGLCIPGEKDPRNQAIALMVKTYADANNVLVLDEGIRTSCRLSTPKEECMMRIATSGWLQRIWTLQEGMLARELHFELNDGIISPTYFDGHTFHVARKVIPLLEHRGRNMASLAFDQVLRNQPVCTVNHLIGLLRYRTTSKPQDEPVAISGLLGVAPGELVHLGAQERMKSLLIRVREVPRLFAVFGWTCFRLSLPNFGWAPISLSQMLWPDDPEDPIKAICTEDGLFGEYTLVRFPEISFPEPVGIILIVEDDDSRSTPMVFNMVLSFFFFGDDRSLWLTIGGFLLKPEALSESMRDEGVGTVVVQEDAPHVPHPDDGSATVACKFVAPASLRYGLPDKVKTSRSQPYWKVVHATVERRNVRVV
ncbi:hypothetical protein DENSPDRAFT_821987 [Dentipellis sp. KUC8613]|nr:hypothetical protein DENSPDRAFT_821987 [Dentipellis sp. KUC8613]